MCLKQPYTCRYVPVRSFGYNFTHGVNYTQTWCKLFILVLGCKKCTLLLVNFGSVKFLQSNHQKQVFKCEALARCAEICVESVMTLRLFVVVEEKSKTVVKKNKRETHRVEGLGGKEIYRPVIKWSGGLE